MELGPEMSGSYRATFVIPKGAHRMLCDTGWEFSSLDRIPQDIVDVLMAELALVETDAYLGMQEFSGKYAKATVLLDEQGQAENIYLRAYGDRDVRGELLRALSVHGVREVVEIFSPSP